MSTHKFFFIALDALYFQIFMTLISTRTSCDRVNCQSIIPLAWLMHTHNKIAELGSLLSWPWKKLHGSKAVQMTLSVPKFKGTTLGILASNFLRMFLFCSWILTLTPSILMIDLGLRRLRITDLNWNGDKGSVVPLSTQSSLYSKLWKK